MTLRQYEAFLKTVECAGVSAAAQALGVSQSALTQLLAGYLLLTCLRTRKDKLTFIRSQAVFRPDPGFDVT